MDNSNKYDLSYLSEGTSISSIITSTKNSEIMLVYGDGRPVQQDQNETNATSELPLNEIMEILDLSSQDLIYWKDETGRKATAGEGIPTVSRDDHGNKNFKVEYKTSDNDVTYSTFKYQNVPIPSHIGEKYYMCETCGKKFSRQSNLKTHTQIHNSEKPFECTDCGKKFRQHYHLKRHERTHTGEKPFSCTTCGRKFRRHESLKTHTRMHTGDTPYVCETCGKKFTLNSSLKMHVKTHSGVKPIIFSRN